MTTEINQTNISTNAGIGKGVDVISPNNDNNASIHYAAFSKLDSEQKIAMQDTEIKRIFSSKNERDILDAKEDDGEAEIASKFEKAAVIVKYEVDKPHALAQDAFLKLLEAAEKLMQDVKKADSGQTAQGEGSLFADQNVETYDTVNDTSIFTKFKDWDGKGDPFAIDEGMQSDDDGEPPDYDSVFGGPKPSEEIQKLYKEATAAIVTLQADSKDAKALQVIQDINNRIITISDKDIGVKLQIPPFERTFHAIAKAKIEEQKQKLINDYKNFVIKNHLPQAWLGKYNSSSISSETNSTNEINYGWPTHTMSDGGCVIGVRRFMRSFKLTVERTVNGKAFLTHEYISDVSMTDNDISRLLASGGLINITDHQKKWTKLDRGNFEKILRCTQTVRRKPYSRKPASDYIVEFKGGRKGILTYSTLANVMSKRAAEFAIADACARDGIVPPWDAPVEPRSPRSPSTFSKIFKPSQSVSVDQDKEKLIEENKALNERINSLESQMTKMQSSLNQKLDDLMKQLTMVAENIQI